MHGAAQYPDGVGRRCDVEHWRSIHVPSLKAES